MDNLYKPSLTRAERKKAYLKAYPRLSEPACADLFEEVLFVKDRCDVLKEKMLQAEKDNDDKMLIKFLTNYDKFSKLLAKLLTRLGTLYSVQQYQNVKKGKSAVPPDIAAKMKKRIGEENVAT